MPLFKVVAPYGVTIRPPYVLTDLTEDQVRPRTKQLRKKGRGFEIVTEVQFKAGELIGIEGKLRGALLTGLKDPETGLTPVEARQEADKAATEKAAKVRKAAEEAAAKAPKLV